MNTINQPAIEQATIQNLAALFPKIMTRTPSGEWLADTSTLTHDERTMAIEAAQRLGVSIEQALSMAFDATGGLLPGETMPFSHIRPPVVGSAMAEFFGDSLADVNLSQEEYAQILKECFSRWVGFGVITKEALAGSARIINERGE